MIDFYMVYVMLSLFERSSIKILFELDGARNPLKADTKKVRKKSSDGAHSEMVHFIKSKNADNIMIR